MCECDQHLKLFASKLQFSHKRECEKLKNKNNFTEAIVRELPDLYNYSTFNTERTDKNKNPKIKSRLFSAKASYDFNPHIHYPQIKKNNICFNLTDRLIQLAKPKIEKNKNQKKFAILLIKKKNPLDTLLNSLQIEADDYENEKLYTTSY